MHPRRIAAAAASLTLAAGITLTAAPAAQATHTGTRICYDTRSEPRLLSIQFRAGNIRSVERGFCALSAVNWYLPHGQNARDNHGRYYYGTGWYHTYGANNVEGTLSVRKWYG